MERERKKFLKQERDVMIIVICRNMLQLLILKLILDFFENILLSEFVHTRVWREGLKSQLF